VNILWQDEFERVRSNFSSEYQAKVPDHTQKPPEEPPRVFISYSHGSSEYDQWVKDLGTFLLQNGIEARLDAWHCRLGMDLAQFMINELMLADRVILVSDEKYAEKADGRVGGVGWETRLIQAEMMRQPDSLKYLVIVRSRQLDDGLPLYLRGTFVMHWPDPDFENQKCQQLLDEVFDNVSIPTLQEGLRKNTLRL
jgi:TIR domain